MRRPVAREHSTRSYGRGWETRRRGAAAAGDPRPSPTAFAGGVAFAFRRSWLTVGSARCYIVRHRSSPARQRTTTMAHTQRRQFLKDLLVTLARGTGTVVLASAATAS